MAFLLSRMQLLLVLSNSLLDVSLGLQVIPSYEHPVQSERGDAPPSDGFASASAVEERHRALMRSERLHREERTGGARSRGDAPIASSAEASLFAQPAEDVSGDDQSPEPESDRQEERPEQDRSDEEKEEQEEDEHNEEDPEEDSEDSEDSEEEGTEEKLDSAGNPAEDGGAPAAHRGENSQAGDAGAGGNGAGSGEQGQSDFVQDRDCEYYAWGAWSPCSKSCAGGRHSRSRELKHHAVGAGERCLEGREEHGPCNLQACSEPCQFTQWSDWIGDCTSCTVLNRTRRRDLAEYAKGGETCASYDLAQEEPCWKHNDCPVDCEWEPWSPWTACDKSCGGGIESRTRVSRPEKHGGQPCLGEARQDNKCGEQECLSTCEWGEWTASECSQTCGGGTLVRTRSPTSVPNSDHSGSCKAQVLNQTCMEDVPCPVDCKYGDWNDWSGCSSGCGPVGTSVRNRTRSIIVADKHGGHKCRDSETEHAEVCHTQPCPIDCVFMEWEDWTGCSTQCGQGTKKRSRSHIKEMHGGQLCDGTEIQKIDCYGNTAPGCEFVMDKALDTSAPSPHAQPHPETSVVGSFIMAATLQQGFKLPAWCMSEHDEGATCAAKTAIEDALHQAGGLPNGAKVRATLDTELTSVNMKSLLEERRTGEEVTLMVRFSIHAPPQGTYEDLWQMNTATLEKKLAENFHKHAVHILVQDVRSLEFGYVGSTNQVKVVSSPPAPTTQRPPQQVQMAPQAPPPQARRQAPAAARRAPTRAPSAKSSTSSWPTTPPPGSAPGLPPRARGSASEDDEDEDEGDSDEEGRGEEPEEEEEEEGEDEASTTSRFIIDTVEQVVHDVVDGAEHIVGLGPSDAQANASMTALSAGAMAAARPREEALSPFFVSEDFDGTMEAAAELGVQDGAGHRQAPA